MDLTGKVTIVTGGGGGSGLAVAERFVTAGATVVIAEIDALAGALAADALDDSVYFIDADVANEPSVRAVVERVMTAYGRIDYLINCASLDRFAAAADLALEDWQRVLGVNLTGPYLFAKHCADELSAAGGAIVNVVSRRPNAFGGSEAYAASKVGLVGLTQSLADRLAPAVRVNCVSPAWALGADTSASNSSGESSSIAAADIAEVVIRLCADADGVATGRHITLDAA